MAALIGDGATLQVGIGAVPDAVLAGLHGRRGLAVWSEMFSDGVLGLAKAGALDPEQPVTASFAFGSADLYAWLDRNPDVRMLRTETVNDPARIARRPRHGLGQRRAPGRPVRPGQRDLGARRDPLGVRRPDRLRGRRAALAGGQAIIALPSWHPKADVSTVVPRLDGPVTSFQHSYIVSEQGAAAIWGHDERGQADQIIDHVAHPSARDELREAGRSLGLLS